MDFTKSGFFLLISQIFRTFTADFKKLRVFMFLIVYFKQKRPAVKRGVFVL